MLLWTSQRRHRMRKKVVLICLKQTEIQDNFTKKNTHWLIQEVVAEVETLTSTTTNQDGKIKRLWGQEIGLTSFEIY